MNIDIIEPYPEEILFSWFLRMARFYGFNTFSVKMMKNFKSMLLSTSSKQLFNIYVPEFLDHLVKVINLPNSNFFQSYISIIEGMSVFPFYSAFVDEDVKDKYYRVFRGATSIREVECAFNIRDSNNYFEGSLNIKICPICIQERGEFYLDREHQVQNNCICYKHKTILRYLKYNRYKCYEFNELDKLNYIDTIKDNDIYLGKH